MSERDGDGSGGARPLTRAGLRRELCAELSALNAEPLAATASRIDHWLLVEYRSVWSRDVLGASSLGAAVKEHLRAQLDVLSHSRLLFVRRPGRSRVRGYSVFSAQSTEEGERLYGLEIERYEDLVELDFAAALRAGGGAGARLEHPLLVVCTHGKRDRCCAKFGAPLYDELCAQAEEGWVWQSTHVGGDRFAGNVVCLPEGLYFGRVGRADVWPLLDEYLAGRIDLDHYRGRSCYSFAVQAAERAVRAASGLTRVHDVRLLASEEAGRGRWRVRFRAGEASEHELEVAAELGAEATYLTCSAVQPRRPRRYVTTAHRVRALR